MLFKPKEKGQSLTEFAIGSAIIVVVGYLILRVVMWALKGFWNFLQTTVTAVQNGDGATIFAVSVIAVIVGAIALSYIVGRNKN